MRGLLDVMGGPAETSHVTLPGSDVPSLAGRFTLEKVAWSEAEKIAGR